MPVRWEGKKGWRRGQAECSVEIGRAPFSPVMFVVQRVSRERSGVDVRRMVGLMKLPNTFFNCSTYVGAWRVVLGVGEE